MSDSDFDEAKKNDVLCAWGHAAKAPPKMNVNENSATVPTLVYFFTRCGCFFAGVIMSLLSLVC